MRSGRHPGLGSKIGRTQALVAGALLPCALGALAGAACSDRSDPSSGQLNARASLARKNGSKPAPKDTQKPDGKPDHGAPDAACSGPSIVPPGTMVVPMPFWVGGCQAGMDCSKGPDTTQLGLDYGDFPFQMPNGLVKGSYYFAVVAPGYDATGFRDGGKGNLSDTKASRAPGDRGSGDTEADRTITNDGQLPVWSPDTHGTHPAQTAETGFQVIQLAPFDETPHGHYELAVCPTGATSHCQCAIEAFDARPHESDGGSAGAGGTGGASGSGGLSNAGGTTSAAGGTPSLDAGGPIHGDGGAAHGDGGATHGDGGSGGAPCIARSKGG